MALLASRLRGWGGSSAKHAAALPEYDGVREQAANRPSRRGTPATRPRPESPCSPLVAAEDPPLRVFFGESPLGIATADDEGRLETRKKFQPLSVAAHGGIG